MPDYSIRGIVELFWKGKGAKEGAKATEQVAKGAEKQAGAPIKIAGFVRYALGEGIDKPPAN